MPKHVIEEAKRCLQCKTPQCKEGCPVRTPINEIIRIFLAGEILAAGKTLFENNPLSVVCSLVCPHEEQCEGHCVLGKKSTPVQFSNIEHYISDYYLHTLKHDQSPLPLDKGKIALIGSGPAGITLAIILANKGYKITIFEANDKIGGVLRYGIPEFRLPKRLLNKLKEKLLEMGVKIRPNTLIGPNLTIDELFRDGYQAIFIGTGVWKPNKLGIKGESLGHVHFAIDYLKNPDVYDLGANIFIIGAGNVAIDVARTILRNGNKKVTIVYRKGPHNMTANNYEIEYAKIDGVRFEYYKSPVEIVDQGVILRNTKEAEHEDGSSELLEIPGTEELYPADSIIVAVSQGPRANIISTTKGLDINTQGLLITDDCGRTSYEGIFASGDVVTGAKTVVEAVKLSKRVVEAIDEYVTSKNSLSN